jgi:hypothetical protein
VTGGGVRAAFVVLVLAAGLTGCTRTIAGLAAPAIGAGPAPAPVSAAPAGPTPFVLGGIPGAPVVGGVECPLAGIAQVGQTLQVDLQGGFPRSGDTPSQVSCEFGVGTAGQGRLRILEDGPAAPGQVAAITAYFAGGQRLAGLGSRAFYRSSGSGAELVALARDGSVGILLDSGPAAAAPVVPGDVMAKLTALAQLVLSRR